MVTRKGWLAVLTGGLCLLGGRLDGAPELYLLGTVFLVLVVGSLVYLRSVRLRIDVTRELHPSRVHAGTPSRVDLVVRNDASRRSSMLEIRDAVSGTRGANLLVAPMPAGGSTRAAYRLPTERRGILTVGPLEVHLSDPFGITSTTLQAAGVSELTVYPRIDDVEPIPQTTGNDPMAGAEHPNAIGRTGDDFYALRNYVVGDDLRRVHWLSTARHDELMVRQDELPWQGRATVVLDVRRDTNTTESLELVVSAAASLITANARRQDLVRLVSTDGTDFGFAAGHTHVEAMLEYLAAVGPTNESNFRPVIDRLARSSSGGALVVVAASMPARDLQVLSRLRSRFGQFTVVLFEPSSWSATGPAPTPARRPGVIRVTAEAPFAQAWNGAVGPRRRATRAWRRPEVDDDGPDRWRPYERVLR